MPARVLINGSDYSESFVSVTAAFSGSYKNGLYVISGTLVLSVSKEVGRSFDDRYNPDLARGKKVEVFPDGASTKGDIVGTLYILTSRLDLETGLVNISVTCILGLLNSRTPEDLAICVMADQGVTATQAIVSLLGFLNITSLNINISNGQKILKPLMLGATQGIVSVAAEIAKSSGYFLFQDRLGTVVSKTAAMNSEPISFNIMERFNSDVKRFNQAELPFTKIIIRGTRSELKELPEVEQVDSETVITRDFVNRVITTVKQKPFGDFVNTTQIIDTYEPITNIEGLNGSIARPGECVPEDEGRLVKRVTSFIQDSNLALDPCLDVHKECEALTEKDIPIFIGGGNVVVRSTIETWDYNLTSAVIADSQEITINLDVEAEPIVPDPGSTVINPSLDPNIGLSKDEVNYRREVRQVKAVASPFICHWTLGNNTLLLQESDVVTPPSGNINTALVELETIRWTKDFEGNWNGKRDVERSEILTDPNKFGSRALAATSLGQINTAKNGLFDRKNIVDEHRNDWTPPDPGRFPPRYTVEETDYERIFTVTGANVGQTEERTLTVNLDIFGDVNSTVERVARSIAFGSWGKYSGSQISSVFYSVSEPLTKISLFEPRDSLAPFNLETYYIDSPSVALTKENKAFSGQGLFVSASDAPFPPLRGLATAPPAQDALIASNGSIGFFDGTEYCVFSYIPISVDLTDPDFIYQGLGTTDEEIYRRNSDGTYFYSKAGAIVFLLFETGTSFPNIDDVPRENIFINIIGQPVDISTGDLLVAPFTANPLPLITQLNQSGTCKVDYQSTNFSSQLVCTRYLAATNFQTYRTATTISETCTRSLGDSISSSLNVIGSNFELPWVDLETNSLIAFIDN